jgi:hypothetical protein
MNRTTYFGVEAMLKEHDVELGLIEETLLRCDRILRDTIVLKSSPASWYVIGGPDDEPYVPKTGPVWKGLPGTHPLLLFIRDALTTVRQLRGRTGIIMDEWGG